MRWSRSRVLGTSLAFLMCWAGSGTTVLLAENHPAGAVQAEKWPAPRSHTSYQIWCTGETFCAANSAEDDPLCNEPANSTPPKSEVPVLSPEAKSQILSYQMNLRARAAEIGMPADRMIQLSAQVTAIAVKGLLAGLPPDDAMTAARAFGEGALTLFRKDKETFSRITGQKVGP